MTTSTASPPPRRGRGRRPAAELRRTILDATADLLLADGVTAVTFDRVAVAAATSKATLYKWWPSPGALAAESYFARVEEDLSFPDTGDLERDLRDQLHAFLHLLTTPAVGTAIGRLIGAAQQDSHLAGEWSRGYSRPRRDLAVARIRAAQAAGQVEADVDPETVVDQLWGACYHRLLIPDEPLTAAFVDALVRNVCHGILRRRNGQPGSAEG
jgi:AcrR family transcriptional regulator